MDPNRKSHPSPSIRVARNDEDDEKEKQEASRTVAGSKPQQHTSPDCEDKAGEERPSLVPPTINPSPTYKDQVRNTRRSRQTLPDYKDQVRDVKPPGAHQTNDAIDLRLRQSVSGPTYKDQVRNSRRAQQTTNEGQEAFPTFKGQVQDVAHPPSGGSSGPHFKQQGEYSAWHAIS